MALQLWIITLLFSSWCNANARTATPWRKVRLTGGKHSVLFPGEPKEHIRNIPSKWGNLKLIEYTAQDPRGALYSIYYMDMPADQIEKMTAQNAIKELKESARRDFPGNPSLQQMKPLALGQHLGFGYSVSVWRNGKEAEVHVRIYLLGNRAYALIVMAAKEMMLPAEDARTFMKSFNPVLEKWGEKR